MTDSVGIIGAGRLGQAMARTALRAGRRVVVANSHGPESLASVVSALGDGVSAGTVDEAASAGIVVVAVPWDRVPEAVQGLDWNGQVVIDATNDWRGRRSPREDIERARRRPRRGRARREGRQHARRGGARRGSSRSRRQARDLYLRRRRRRESGSRHVVPSRGLRCHRPRRPCNGRRDAADPPPPLRRQPHPTLRTGRSPFGSIYELSGSCTKASVGWLRPQVSPGALRSGTRYATISAAGKKTRLKRKIQEEAMTLATGNTSWPEGDGDPNDEGQRPPQPETVRRDHCGTSPYRPNPEILTRHRPSRITRMA